MPFYMFFSHIANRFLFDNSKIKQKKNYSREEKNWVKVNIEKNMQAMLTTLVSFHFIYVDLYIHWAKENTNNFEYYLLKNV